MEINYLNLKRMFNHILENVPEEKIKMSLYRPLFEQTSHECQTVGCVLGHSVILDNWDNVPKKSSNNINFRKWSELFTNIKYHSYCWYWCFGASWPNDKEQILLRIKYLIDNKNMPDDWDGFSYSYELENINLEKY